MSFDTEAALAFSLLASKGTGNEESNCESKRYKFDYCSSAANGSREDEFPGVMVCVQLSFIFSRPIRAFLNIVEME